ncbi:MAG: galactose mutarotase [Spirochaetes bacterium]|jgi:aldose 1-epimerase|nr:galactose mutarotase [Spirochaetota bacterium]
MQKELFGRYNDREVNLYTLTDGKMSARITNFGASLVSLTVPDKTGALRDVVLGYDTLDGYINNSCYVGVTVGRYANRIGGAAFSIDGIIFPLSANEGGNTLHGGSAGFDRLLWNVDNISENSITLSLTSSDGDQGFPGAVKVLHTITVTDGELQLEYQATTDKKTHVNLTNHSYFNLNGEGSGTINNHTVTIPTAFITEVDNESIPTGAITEMKGSFFDLRNGSKISDKLKENSGMFYDINYVLNNEGAFALAATVTSEESGITIEAKTDAPGIQFYGGQFIDSVAGKNGHTYNQNDGFCLEAQLYPDTPNKGDFPSSLLLPGQTYTQKTVYRFSCRG